MVPDYRAQAARYDRQHGWPAASRLGGQRDPRTAISRLLHSQALEGVADICPANASFMVRFDPDVIAPFDLEARVRAAEQEVGDTPSLTLQTRIVEVPVWYDDPFTNETAARFRDRHQRKEGNDLDFAAAENGLSSVQDFIARHSGSPWITSMVGFVAGLPSFSRWSLASVNFRCLSWPRPSARLLRAT